MYAVRGFYQGDKHIVLPEWTGVPISGNYEVVITFLEPMISDTATRRAVETHATPQKPDIHYPEPDLIKRQQAFKDFSRFAGTLRSDFNADKARIEALEAKYI
jgi:hypothetical protein